MHLTRLELQNFKACRSVDLELAPLTVLIGANNAGKSSILHSLALQAQSAPFGRLVSTGSLVDLGSRLDALVHREVSNVLSEPAVLRLNWAAEPTGPPVVNFAMQIDARANVSSTLRVALTLGDGSDALIDASGDTITGVVGVGDMKVTEQFRAQQSSLWAFGPQGWSSNQNAQVLVALQQSTPYLAQFAAEALRRFRYVGVNRHIESSIFPLGREPVANPRTAQELVDTLAYDDRLLDRVSARCQAIFEYGVDKELIPPQQITIVAKSSGGGLRNVVNLGTGFIQTVWLLTQLELALAEPLSEQWQITPTVGIEEPELHIHPGLQPDIARLLSTFVRAGLTVICTTQSEHLLIALLSLVLEGELSADQIVVYYLQDGQAEKLAVDEQGRIEGGLRGFFEANEEQLRRQIQLLKQRG